jgi:predicted nucleotide-binding protein
MALPLSRIVEEVLGAAENHARETKHVDVSTADLLLALALIKPSLAAEALAMENVTPEGVRRRIAARASTNSAPGTAMSESEDVRTALESAEWEANGTSSAAIEPEHLLTALMKTSADPNEASRIVHELGSTTSRVRERVQQLAQQRQSKRIFVAHGRDSEARDVLFDFLRSLSLEPLQWESIVKISEEMSPPLSRALARALDNAQACVVLMTPDDFGQLHRDFHEDADSPSDTSVNGQPRQNVIFEAGMALSKMPERTLFVEVGRLRGFNDMAGLNVVRLTPDVTTCMERLTKISQRLKSAGCAVDDSGTDWLRYAHRFAQLRAYTRGPSS